MNVQEILMRFALIANLNLEEAAPWISICSEAEQELRALLKDASLEQANSMRLNAAAAALAFYRYTLYRASGSGMNDFSVGDIKVVEDKKTSVELAKRIWEESKLTVLDIIVDNEFLVGQVKII